MRLKLSVFFNLWTIGGLKAKNKNRKCLINSDLRFSKCADEGTTNR